MAIQDKFNRANVIYKITKDIDLGGETLTIPEGCTLDFQGGSFSNGTIEGNNTAIQASITKIFGLDIELAGTWNVAEAYPEWFGAISDYKLNGTYTNNTPFFKKCADSFKHISLPIEGKYYLNETLYINGDTSIFGNNSYIVINETLDYGICITSDGGVIFNNAEIKDLTIHTNTQRPPVKQIYAFKIERNVNKHFNNIILQPYGIGFIYFGNDVWDIEINSCNCRSYESTWNCVIFTHYTNINIKFNDFHIEGYDTVFTTTLENFDQNIYLNTFVVGGLTKTIIDGNKGCLYVFVNNFHIETDGMLGTQFKNANIVCTNGIYICTGILEEDIAYKCHITFNNVHFVGFSGDRYKKTKFSSSGTIIYNNCSSTATLAPAPSNSVPFNGNLRLNSFSDINIGWSENPDDTAVASQPVYVQNDSISLNGYDTGIYVKIPNNWNTNRICVSFDVMRTNAGAQATQLEVIGLCRDSKRTQVINRGGINITDRVLNDTYITIKVLLSNIIEAGSPDISKLVYISTFGGFQTYKIKNINIFPLNYYY